MKKLIQVSIFLFLAFTSFSQERPPELQQKLDSLWNVWEDKTQKDSLRIVSLQAYINQGYTRRQGYTSKLDSALYFANILYDFAESTGNKQHIANALYFQARLLKTNGKKNEALDIYQQAVKLYKELGDQAGLANTYFDISRIYQDRDDYTKALEFFFEVEKIYRETNDEEGFPSLFINIGNIYLDTKDYAKASEYYSKGKDGFTKLGNKSGIAAAFENLAAVSGENGNYPEARDYYQQALKLREEIQDSGYYSNDLLSIALTYVKQENYDAAIEYANRSLKIAKMMNSKRLLAYNASVLGDIYNGKQQYEKAVKEYEKALEIFKQRRYISYQEFTCKSLYEVNKKMGNWTKALAYYEQSVILKDSLFNEENTKKMTQLGMQYEFDKKEAVTQAEQEKKDALAAQKLERQKLVRNGFMGGFAVVLLFAGVFFIQRNKIGKEKERSEELLLNILPEEVAEELKEKGHSDAQLIDQVTVLFTDFKGFTTLSEKVTPKELVKDLHECFSAFDKICEKYEIEKIKTIGDAYMAAGGLPSPNKTHAQDVVNAALEMAEVIEKGKAKKIAQGLPFFEVRIGVHTGSVVAGIVGVKKFQYDIWGDTVNTASRMESNSEVGKVNISEATYNYLKDDTDFIFESRGKINAKGKGEIEMYFVKRA